jgi:hypothetical protein
VNKLEYGNSSTLTAFIIQKPWDEVLHNTKNALCSLKWLGFWRWFYPEAASVTSPWEEDETSVARQLMNKQCLECIAL